MTPATPYSKDDTARFRRYPIAVGYSDSDVNEERSRFLATLDARDAEIERLTKWKAEHEELDRLHARFGRATGVTDEAEKAACMELLASLSTDKVAQVTSLIVAQSNDIRSLRTERDALRGLVREAIPLLLVLETQQMLRGGSVLDAADRLVAKLTSALSVPTTATKEPTRGE